MNTILITLAALMVAQWWAITFVSRQARRRIEWLEQRVEWLEGLGDQQLELDKSFTRSLQAVQRHLEESGDGPR